MAIKVTRLQDVFTQKVKDFLNMPTIWLDSITGEEHEDYEHTHIESHDPRSFTWREKRTAPSYVIERVYSMDEKPGTFRVNGPIKQIGSHVIECGSICIDQRDNMAYPYLDQLDQIFKYATNLESLHNTFKALDIGTNEFIIPENLFWNCNKLKTLQKVFNGTNLKHIPENLLAKCPNLESVRGIFCNTMVSEIPEDLFKNNPKITDFNSAFRLTEIKKIPDKLLEPFKDEILKHKISVDNFINQTPIQVEITNSYKPKEKKLIKAQYFPSYLNSDIMWDMLGGKSWILN